MRSTTSLKKQLGISKTGQDNFSFHSYYGCLIGVQRYYKSIKNEDSMICESHK
jgi:hypothetical protein